MAVAEGKRLLLVALSDFMTDKPLCLAHYLFSTNFRNSSGYWLVYEVSFSGLIPIPMSQFLNDYNFQK